VRVELPISPLEGEMPGRAEGGAKERDASRLAFLSPNSAETGNPSSYTLAGQRPPLPCRTSPPLRGRLADSLCPAIEPSL